MAQFFAVPMSDREIVAALETLSKLFPTCTISLQIFQINQHLKEYNQEDINKLKKSNGYSITRFSLDYGKNSFVYERSHGKETHLAKIEASRNENAPEANSQFDFNLFVSKFLGNPPPSGPEPSGEASVSAGYSKSRRH